MNNAGYFANVALLHIAGSLSVSADEEIRFLEIQGPDE
jgi:hypothetical protein